MGYLAQNKGAGKSLINNSKSRTSQLQFLASQAPASYGLADLRQQLSSGATL